MFGQKRKQIDALDLSAIAAGVARRHGWPSERVESAESEYRKFLYLLMRCPGQTLTPWGDDLDQFWHEHILHTERYAGDCRHLFGCFINHDPTIAERPAISAKLESIWAYRRAFGFDAAEDGAPWYRPSAASLEAIEALLPGYAAQRASSGASCGGVGGGGGHGCGGGGGGHGCGGGSCGGGG